MVWEALAKSLPDLPVGESPYGGGCSTMGGDGSGCIFMAFRSRSAFMFVLRMLISDDGFVLGLSTGGWIDIREGAHRGPPRCCCAEARTTVVMPGTIMGEQGGFGSVVQKHPKQRK